jgi:hypothetical protein
MKRIDIDFKNYIGQGENSDLFVSVIEYDRKFDRFFGIDYEESEKNISRNEEYIYPGLEDTALLTSYLDYFQIYRDLPQGATIVDLGAGYCRGSMLFSSLELKRCISVECEQSRTKAALSICPNDILIADLVDKKFVIPKAEFYFIYLPVGIVLYEIIRKVIQQKIEATFYVVESHGDLIDYLLMLPKVFKLINKPFKVSLPRHDPYIYKFKSKAVHLELSDFTYKQDLVLWHLFNHDKNLKMKISSTIPGKLKRSEWEANLSGSTVIKYNNRIALYLENPSRVLQLGNQDEILSVTR